MPAAFLATVVCGEVFQWNVRIGLNGYVRDRDTTVYSLYCKDIVRREFKQKGLVKPH
jgi:hypothetical protein